MSRKHYEITMTFTYGNGEPGGILCCTVNSRKAVDLQIAANREWLTKKGHVENDVTVVEVAK